MNWSQPDTTRGAAFQQEAGTSNGMPYLCRRSADAAFYFLTDMLPATMVYPVGYSIESVPLVHVALQGSRQVAFF